jgi:hypothetical protein
MSMTVYIVQRLHWEYDDVFFILEAEQPVKAFVKRESAEAYRKELEDKAKETWIAEHRRECLTVNGLEEIPEKIYEVVVVEITDSQEGEVAG